uniref:Phage Mu protein F like protein n=1 Tax=Marinobacter nauticus TaxID=2743 RepID=A0A455W7I4_MARNT|nr:hypothetical protein YBY_30090 [Marinobacter nauticus]
MASTRYGSLPFREQIEFFRRKLNIPTRSWVDVYASENDWGFAVAGANRRDLLQDFRTAIDKVIADGGTLDSFRKDFDSIVRSHGWDYNGGRNWRSRVIYETNLWQSYNAGRQEQLNAARSAMPYRRYRHSLAVEDPREEHLAWDGLILRSDDPWWDAHTPMNGWGCKCYVEGLTELDLEELGKSGPDTAPDIEWETREIGQRSSGGPRRVQVPKGIDPGFEHAPGQSRLQSAQPPELPGALRTSTAAPGLPNRRAGDGMPAPRALPRDTLLPQSLPEEDYVQAFLDVFGATPEQPTVFRDVVGDALVIGQELFRDRKTGGLKANKRGRGPYMRVLAEAIRNPDEVWVRLERMGARDELVVRRRYLARFTLPGKDVPTLAVFEAGAEGWAGITAFQAEEEAYLQAARMGIRLYRRGEE